MNRLAFREKMASRDVAQAFAPSSLSLLLLPLLVFCMQTGMTVAGPVAPAVDQAGGSAESRLDELLARLQRELASEGSVDSAYRHLNVTASEWMSQSRDLLKALADFYQAANASGQEPPEDAKIPLMLIAAAVSGMFEGHEAIKQGAFDHLWPLLVHGDGTGSASSGDAGAADFDFSGISVVSDPTGGSKTGSGSGAGATATTKGPLVPKTPSNDPRLSLEDDLPQSKTSGDSKSSAATSKRWTRTFLGKVVLWVARIVNKGGDIAHAAFSKVMLLFKKLLSWIGFKKFF